MTRGGRSRRLSSGSDLPGPNSTAIPLPTHRKSAADWLGQPIQVTDYNRLVTLGEGFLGAEKGFFPAVRERSQGR